MDLGDILSNLPDDSEEQKRTNQLIADLNALRDRLAIDRSRVSDAEILDGIRKQFDLVPSSDFLEHASWLMEALSFTSLIIKPHESPSAWRKFQDERMEMTFFTLSEYPLLEGMAYWYFQHREEGPFDERHMIIHALAMYEYLVQQVRGWEANDEFADIFSGVGMHVFYLYYGLRNAERAKLYAQLLEMEFLAGRLDEEDFRSVQELTSVIHSFEQEEESERAKILQLQWNTITDREKELQERDDRIRKLEHRYEVTLALVGTRADINHANDLLSRKFGSLWNRLHSETRRSLALAEAFSQPALSETHPDIPPNAFFKALNSEILARIFLPFGSLEPAMLGRLGVQSPVALLIDYIRVKSWPKADRSAISEALKAIGEEKLICSKANLDLLTFVRHHRNKTEHTESHGGYSQRDLENLLSRTSNSNLLLGFLRHLNGH